MRTQNVAITRWIADATVALLPVLACFLGGSTQKWEEGIVITVLAICLLVRPPRFSLGALTNLVLLALFILAAVAFFPGRWFFQPEWRAALVNDFGIQLPSTLTPQPWITLGYLVSFAAGLSWLYVVSTQDLELREVRFQLRLFTSGIALLAAICIALYLARTTLAFWHNDQNFGPFPNRNQTGALFALAAIVILACAQDDLRKRRKRWIVWILALVLIGAAIILNFSRSGVAILMAGSAFWLGTQAFRQRSPWRLALGISLSLLLCYSRRCCFSAGKHSRDFIFTISAVPTSHRISGGKFFMTRFDSFVIRPGAGSVLEISNRSLQFFVTLPSAAREPCIRKATGFGFGLNSGGQPWCLSSSVSRCLLVELSRCEREPTKVIVSPRLSQRSCLRSMELSMFPGTRWVRRLRQYFCLGSQRIGRSL